MDLAALLQGSPRLTLLVTSRVPPRLASEQRYSTPPLGLPRSTQATFADAIEADAVAFFVERAQRVRPGFRLTATNVADVVAICRRLDGLPLAIELAAAWSHLLSPTALLEQLERRLPMLIGGAADQPRRLQTMRDAIAWSYDLLTEDAQRLFRRLAIFNDGFPLEAATRVWMSPATQATAADPAIDRQAVVRLLAALLDAGDRAAAANTSGELDPTLARLSARERQVLRRIAQGQSDREIAEALFISRKTVSNH